MNNKKNDDPDKFQKVDKEVIRLLRKIGKQEPVIDEVQQERWYQRFIKELSKWLRPKRP